MKFTLTPKQIVAIYNAGRECGSDEQCSYDWGKSRSKSYMHAELKNCMFYDETIEPFCELDYDGKQVMWEEFLGEINK